MNHPPTGPAQPFEGIAPPERRAHAPGPRQPRPVATWCLLGGMAAGYLVEMLAGVTPGQGFVMGPSQDTLIALGANLPEQVLAGQWHTMLTNWYLHGNLGHLIANGIALWYAGAALERWVGRSWLLTIFVAGELGGSILSALMNHSIVSFGASGAIMGVLCATYLAGHRLTDAPGRAAVMRGTMLLLILTLIPVPSAMGAVDHWGHLGGAVAGLALALALHPVWPGAQVRRAWQPWVGRAAVAALVVAMGLQVGPYAGYKGSALTDAKQDEAAVGWYAVGDRLGDRASTERLGYAYWKGVGVPEDHPRAFALMARAAEAGSPWAQKSLGAMYERGDGTKADPAQAVAWLRKAAEAGDAAAQVDLGEAYLEGNGVPTDRAIAVQWLERADAQGYAFAAYSLGFEYADGKRLKRDHTKALHYFTRAAEGGNADARSHLGYQYYTGEGVAKDYTRAYGFTKQAAEQGEGYAQFNLGEMYELGRGVARDRDLAYQWYYAASENADLDDADTRKELAGILTRLAKAMGPEAVTAARQRAMAGDTAGP